MASDPSLRLAAGNVLDGKYRIDALLGQGGMGAVYRATHLGTTRTVAVKVIQPRLSTREEFVERFRREAAAAGRLRHPNVVDVTDFGVARVHAETIAYLVMEFLDGCSLAEVLAEEQRLPKAWVVDILEQVCSAVDAAHRRGMVHRDLKPDNIWLQPNRRGGYTVKVLDFGLVKASDPLTAMQPPPVSTASSHQAVARTPTPAPFAFVTPTPTAVGVLDAVTIADRTGTIAPTDDAADAAVTVPTSFDDRSADGGLTVAGSATGTPAYMSPEQCRGGSVDHRSDIYSLGVIAYRMLSGVAPFSGGAAADLMRSHVTMTPRPLREVNRRIPARMSDAVMAALAKRPDDRPATAGGFAASLRAAAEGSGTLLQQAAAIYSERFPTMIAVSCAAYVPLMIDVTILFALDREGHVGPFGHAGPIGSVVIIASMIAASLLSYFAVSAATVPLVVQTIAAPLRPLHARTAWMALRRRWLAFTVTTLVVLTSTFVGSVFLIVPGIAAALLHVLYAPVVMMEEGTTWTMLRRARELAQRSWSTVLIIGVLQFALPTLVWIATIDVSFSLTLDAHWRPDSFGFGVATSGRHALYQLLNVFVTPLTAIMTALLYLKMRQAGGESLTGVAERLASAEVERSRWQSRITVGESGADRIHGD